MILLRMAAALCALMFGLSPVSAQSAAQKGEQIAQEAERRGEGYRDLRAKAQMILRNKMGGTSERRFDLSTLETSDGSRSLMEFDWPGDIRDTALLTHSFDNRDDNQWLYLPSIRRAKRISGSGRAGSFMGSEFAYEDMVDQSASKYSHEWVRDEACPGRGGLTCHVIDRVPRRSSGYSRQRVWLDTGELRALRVDFFDRRGAHLKTMTASGFNRYKGRYWRPSKVRMRNHLTGKSSDLNWSGYRFGTGVSPSQFSVNALRN